MQKKINSKKDQETKCIKEQTEWKQRKYVKKKSMEESNFFFLLPANTVLEMILTQVFPQKGHQRKNELSVQVIQNNNYERKRVHEFHLASKLEKSSKGSIILK